MSTGPTCVCTDCDCDIAIGELQLAVQALNDVTKAHREMLQGLGSNVAEIQGGMLEASGHACDDRPRCAKCGIRSDRHHQTPLIRGWAAILCDACLDDPVTLADLQGAGGLDMTDTTRICMLGLTVEELDAVRFMYVGMITFDRPVPAGLGKKLDDAWFRIPEAERVAQIKKARK